jgi:aryl-alcohol dehydrogenase-like predicted oxidoreductase
MKFNRLGNSGLLVSDLALGTMIFGEASDRATPPDVSERMILRYIDAGGNHIDTADVYANGKSEEILGSALKGKRDKIILATKVRFSMSNDPNDVGLSRYHIMRSVHESLRRLKTDYIDIYYMHAPDPLTPVEESLRVFDDLVIAGKVRYIGVSNFKLWQLMKALRTSDLNGWNRFTVGQYQYSLIQRDIEYEFIELFLDEGIGLTPWGPLGGGFLSGKYKHGVRPTKASEGRIAVMPTKAPESWENRNIKRNWEVLKTVDEVAKAHGATYSQIALAWLRAKPAVSSVILGARTMEQLEDNLKTGELDLTAEEMQKLDKVSALPPLYPYSFLEGYGKRTANPE